MFAHIQCSLRSFVVVLFVAKSVLHCVLLLLRKADSWGCIAWFSLEGVLINVQHACLEIVRSMMFAD